MCIGECHAVHFYLSYLYCCVCLYLLFCNVMKCVSVHSHTFDVQYLCAINARCKHRTNESYWFIPIRFKCPKYLSLCPMCMFQAHGVKGPWLFSDVNTRHFTMSFQYVLQVLVDSTYCTCKLPILHQIINDLTGHGCFSLFYL